ncbi:unnamed protein product, partial [Ectocarpus sp. 6 AP-2014]
QPKKSPKSSFSSSPASPVAGEALIRALREKERSNTRSLHPWAANRLERRPPHRRLEQRSGS